MCSDGPAYRNLQQTKSECTGVLYSYVIARRYGIDVSGFNLERIAQMQEYGKKDPQELRNFLNDIRQASYTIRNHVERNFGAKEQEFTTDELPLQIRSKHRNPKRKSRPGKRKNKDSAGTIKVKNLDGWSSYYGSLVIWLV